MTPSRDAIDLDLLRRQTLGEPDLEADLFDLFELQCSRLWDVIAAPGNTAARLEAAHTLRGGAGAVGAVHVMALSEDIEHRLGEEGRGEPDEGTLQALSDAIADARRVIRELRASASGRTTVHRGTERPPACAHDAL